MRNPITQGNLFKGVNPGLVYSTLTSNNIL